MGVEASKVKLKFVRSDGAILGGIEPTMDNNGGWNIGCGGEWTIPNDGLGNFANLAYNVETSTNILTDGSSLVSKRVEETDRTVTMVYNGKNPDKARSDAIAFFNPRFSFELHAQYRGNTRYCVGELTGFDAPAENVHAAPTMTVTMLCMDPFWRNENGHEEAFGDAKPMFGFPFVSHQRKPRADGKRLPPGFLCGKLVYDGENSVYNRGDVPCMYRIVCTFKGAVSNPEFIKNDRHVKLVDQYSLGDVLEIDFEASPPTVTRNGVNSIQRCTRDSDFVNMAMEVGDNTFTYTCDQPETHRALMSVQLLYNDRYLGL